MHTQSKVAVADGLLLQIVTSFGDAETLFYVMHEIALVVFYARR